MLCAYREEILHVLWRAASWTPIRLNIWRDYDFIYLQNDKIGLWKMLFSWHFENWNRKRNFTSKPKKKRKKSNRSKTKRTKIHTGRGPIIAIFFLVFVSLFLCSPIHPFKRLIHNFECYQSTYLGRKYK